MGDAVVMFTVLLQSCFLFVALCTIFNNISLHRILQVELSAGKYLVT